MTPVNYVLADEILDRFFFSYCFQVFVDLFNNIKTGFVFSRKLFLVVDMLLEVSQEKKTIGRYIRLGPVLSIMWPCIQEKLAYAR